MIGFLFVFSDRIFYALVSESEDTMGLKVREMWQNGKLVEGLKTLLLERDEPKKLTMRSVLFVVIWLILGLWAVVGALNPFARGLVLGIGVHLLFDLAWDYFNKGRGILHWFWQIRRPMTVNEVRGFFWAAEIIGVIIIKSL